MALFFLAQGSSAILRWLTMVVVQTSDLLLSLMLFKALYSMILCKILCKILKVSHHFQMSQGFLVPTCRSGSGSPTKELDPPGRAHRDRRGRGQTPQMHIWHHLAPSGTNELRKTLGNFQRLKSNLSALFDPRPQSNTRKILSFQGTVASDAKPSSTFLDHNRG